MDRFAGRDRSKNDDAVKGDGKPSAEAEEREVVRERPTADPPRVVTNPTVDGDNSPGVAPLETMVPDEPLPQGFSSSDEEAGDEGNEEETGTGSKGDAAERAFTADPAPASLLLPAVQAVQQGAEVVGVESAYQDGDDLIPGPNPLLLPIEDLDFSVTGAVPGPSGLGGDEVAWLQSDDADGVAVGDRPLEFIIGDMMPGSGGILDARSPEDTSTFELDERPLEFNPIAGLDSETEVLDATGNGDYAGVALGGPDTTERIVGLPDVPNVGDGFPETEPLDMTKADVISEISAEPLAYNQAETLASSFADDDDGDPFDGM